jgi:hypothetical protein
VRTLSLPRRSPGYHLTARRNSQVCDGVSKAAT